jgi:hypothetical protein
MLMRRKSDRVRIDPVLDAAIKMGQAGARMHVACRNLKGTQDCSRSDAYHHDTDERVHFDATNVPIGQSLKLKR